MRFINIHKFQSQIASRHFVLATKYSVIFVSSERLDVKNKKQLLLSSVENERLVDLVIVKKWQYAIYSFKDDFHGNYFTVWQLLNQPTVHVYEISMLAHVAVSYACRP